jgi:flagellar basal-body rod protein FlgB
MEQDYSAAGLPKPLSRADNLKWPLWCRVNQPFKTLVHAGCMNPMRIGLFDLAERRLAWTDRRQAVLAQNIANTNTPGYKPHDLRPFAAALGLASGIEPVRTRLNHLRGSAAVSQDEVVERPSTRAPDGNAVALDEQLVQVADTETTHSMVTTIYKKYLGMFAMALGRGGSG